MLRNFRQPTVTDSAQKGDFSEVKQLLLRGADVNEQDSAGWSALHFACRHGNIDAVKMLIKASANVDLMLKANDKEFTLLHLTIEKFSDINGMEIVRLLIEAGANVNCLSSNGSPLHMAARFGRESVVEELITAGAQLDIRGHDQITPLYMATQCGQRGVVEQLIRAGADIRGYGRVISPLHVAIEHGRNDIAELMICAGADVDLRGDFGQTPLHFAAFYGRESVVELLIGTQADVNCMCTYTQMFQTPFLTPLHIASALKRSGVLSKLINAGADVKVQVSGFGGITALHLAVLSGDEESCEILLRNEPRADDKDKLLRLFIALAEKRGHSGVVSQLRKSGITLFSCGKSPATDAAADQKPMTGDPRVEEADFSASLSSSMRDAGFKSANASILVGTAELLQDYLNEIRNTNKMFVFGSFSEGWGSSLTAIDGRVADDSDIDVTFLDYRYQSLCIGGSDCSCSGIHVEYEDGHVKYHVDAASPNVAIPSLFGTTASAMDLIGAFKCCCYPKIELLEPGYQSNISPDIIEALKTEVTSPQCHVVAAETPRLPRGQSMRVSTTLMERIVMRSLTTIQGQFFILIKYLIKRVINKQVKGLKTYIAKNLLFYMLDRTPASEWQPRNLTDLVRKCLKMLTDMMNESDSDDVCMKHFFLRDANVYIKIKHSSKTVIQTCVSTVSDEVSKLLKEFQNNLRSNDTDIIHFQPFEPFFCMRIPAIHVDEASHWIKDEPIVFTNIYDLVRLIVTNLNGQFTLDELMQDIEKIPDFAKTTRECLQAMARLKVGQKREEAVSCIDSSQTVSRGIPCPSDDSQMSVDDAKKLATDHLNSTDSVWKFVFLLSFDHELYFSFLPDSIRPVMSPMYRYGYWYMNFDALARALRQDSVLPLIEDFRTEVGDSVLTELASLALNINVECSATLPSMSNVTDGHQLCSTQDNLNLKQDDVD